MTDTFNEVPAFVAVVDAGGFSIAARRLNLSRSAVGKAIARLEDRLGVRLFHRTTRTLSLTEEGQAFYEHCQRALAELSTGKALIDSGRIAVTGRLRMSMPVLFGRLYVAPVLTRLAAMHPALELDLHFSDRLVDLIDDGFDLGLRNGPFQSGAGLMTRLIAREQKAVCSSPAYLERYGTPRTVLDLLDHQAITYGRNGRFQKWLFPRERERPLEITPPSRLRLNDIEAIADAAVAGFGLVWLPLWLVRNRLRSGELVHVLADMPALVSDIQMIWPATPHLPSRVRVAIDALAAEVPGLITV